MKPSGNRKAAGIFSLSLEPGKKCRAFVTCEQIKCFLSRCKCPISVFCNYNSLPRLQLLYIYCCSSPTWSVSQFKRNINTVCKNNTKNVSCLKLILNWRSKSVFRYIFRKYETFLRHFETLWEGQHEHPYCISGKAILVSFEVIKVVKCDNLGALLRSEKWGRLHFPSFSPWSHEFLVTIEAALEKSFVFHWQCIGFELSSSLHYDCMLRCLVDKCKRFAQECV